MVFSNTKVMKAEEKNKTCPYSTYANSVDTSNETNLQYINETGESFEVIFEKTEAYFIDNNNRKVILLRVVNSERGYLDNLIENYYNDPTLSQFLRDFEKTGEYENTNIEISEVAKEGADIVADLITGYIVKAMGIGSVGLGVLAAEVITAMAKAIVKYPGKSEIKFNYEFYRCKSCIQYLSGMTFTMEGDGQDSDRLFAWNWGENPQLGIVNAQCKTMSQTYPYLS